MAYLSSSVRAAGCDERALAASRHTHDGYVDIVGPVVPMQSQQRSIFARALLSRNGYLLETHIIYHVGVAVSAHWRTENLSCCHLRS